MEKERRIKILSVVALIIAVLGLTIAFASLSTTLKINGSASVDAASWDIHFEEQSRYSNSMSTGGNGKFVGTPIINGTSITNINVVLTKPGDYAKFNFNIVNNGTINAKLIEERLNSLLVYPYDDEELDDSSMLEYAKTIFSSADFDGDGNTTDDEYIKAMYVIEFCGDDNYGDYSEDIIEAGESHGPIGIYFGYRSDATELPKGEVVLKIDSWDFVFAQAE